MHRVRTARIVIAGGLGVAAHRLLRRRSVDPAHAKGKRHRGPSEPVEVPVTGNARPGHDQPWVRRSHSDSQQRRFRR